jgi:uncharacterized protein (UPF0218 family)
MIHIQTGSSTTETVGGIGTIGDTVTQIIIFGGIIIILLLASILDHKLNRRDKSQE